MKLVGVDELVLQCKVVKEDGRVFAIDCDNMV